MAVSEWFMLIHPTIAVVIVFQLLGIILYQAWLTQARRLALKDVLQDALSTGLPRINGWINGHICGVSRSLHRSNLAGNVCHFDGNGTRDSGDATGNLSPRF